MHRPARNLIIFLTLMDSLYKERRIQLHKTEARRIISLDALDRRGCCATDAAAMGLVCCPHVVQIFGDRVMRCAHDGADDGTNTRKHSLRRVECCAELFSEKARKIVD